MFASLLALVVVCVLIGIGIVLGLAGLALTAGLVGAGVLSSSVVVGIWRGRAQAAWRALFLQCGILAGIPAGMLCAWVGTQVWQNIDGTLVTILATGALAGALGGAVIALFFDVIATRTHAWLAARIERARAVPLPVDGRVVQSTQA
jgi:hypothetical protein